MGQFLFGDLFLGSGGGLPPLVQDIGVCLVVAGVLSVIFTRLKIPNIAAFLAAGVIVGPVVGRIVTDPGNIGTIAGLGLVLLLFLIGLEIDLRKLLSSGKTLILSGLLQFPLCVGFGLAVAYGFQALGWDAFTGKYVPLYVGFITAASSTLLVVKLFQDKGQLDTLVGRVSLGILIFQDIWAIVVLAVQPNFANPELGTVGLTFLGIGIVTVVAVLLAKYVLPVAFKWISMVPELMLVAAAGWCFGLGFFGMHIGTILEQVGIHLHISVSMEMGALIAGASIASFPYSHEVNAKVGNVRDFFVTLFFVALGMGIPKPEGMTVILMALALAGISIAARYIVFFPLMYFTGMDRRNSMVGSTRLAQISEFCLVIAYLGLNFQHVDEQFVSAVIFGFVITALMTPSLFNLGDFIHDKLGGVLTKLGFKPPKSAEQAAAEGHTHDIVMLGFHRVASTLLHELQKRESPLLHHLLILDFNVSLHSEIVRRGAHVHYADISNLDSLSHSGAEKAKVVVCTIPDDVLKGTSNLKLTAALRRMNPKARIIVNALTFEAAQEMYKAGADYVYLQRVYSADALVHVLEAGEKDGLAELRQQQDVALGGLAQRTEVLK